MTDDSLAIRVISPSSIRPSSSNRRLRTNIKNWNERGVQQQSDAADLISGRATWDAVICGLALLITVGPVAVVCFHCAQSAMRHAALHRGIRNPREHRGRSGSNFATPDIMPSSAFGCAVASMSIFNVDLELIQAIASIDGLSRAARIVRCIINVSFRMNQVAMGAFGRCAERRHAGDRHRRSYAMMKSTIAALGFAALAAMPSGAYAQSLITLDAAAVAAVPSQTTPEKITLRPLLQSGGDVVAFRVWLPANTDIAPHTHPAGKVAIVTLMSGDLKVGLGDKYDEAALKPIAPGGVIVFRDTDPKHFARTGNGPVELLLLAAPKGSVNPAWQGGK